MKKLIIFGLTGLVALGSYGKAVGDLAFTDVVVAGGDLVINVMDYGALGDDSNDDTAEIQAAMDAANAARMPLFFPAGTYRITDTLTMVPSHHGVIIRGAGQYATTIKQYTSGKDGLLIDSTGENYWEGLTVEDMRFTGLDFTGIGLRVEGGSGTIARCYIKGVQVGRWGVGILMNECDQSCIIATAAQGNMIGIRVTGNSNGFNLLNTVVTGNQTGGMDIDEGSGVNIIGCDIGNGTVYSGDYMVRAGNGSLIVEGCNFEVHKDLPGCIISTNKTRLTLIGNTFAKIAAPTWTSPAVLLGTGGVNYPSLHSYNNVMAGAVVGTPFIRRWSDSSQVFGLANSIGFANRSANSGSIETVTQGGSTWPAYDSTRDVRQISPFTSHWKTITPEIGTVGQMYWKYSSGNTADDLIASYATSSNTYALSSVLNKNIINDLKAWKKAHPIVATDNISTVATALEALQTVIESMGL